MKKLIIIASVFIFTFAIAIGVKADEMQLKSIETILAEIRLEQGVSNDKSIDVSKVSQARLEELGDSVMEKVIGNSAQHDLIDNRLGGDGSASLSAVHVRIGYDYLMGYPISRMYFMRGGMMNGNYFDAGVRPVSDPGWIGLLAGFVILLLTISGVTYFVIVLTRPKGNGLQNPALEIAKQRYAKGEITRVEFEEIKERLKL